MRIRKMLLLVSMAAAATAFGAAPAAQATAPEWYVHTETGEEKLKGTFLLDVTGTVAAQAGSFISGPCEFTLIGEAQNGLGMALGEITEGEVQTNCETSALGCVVTPTINASAGGPWDVTGATVGGKPGLEVIGLSITNHYTGVGCAMAGIPSTVVITGTATAQLDGSTCLSFKEVKDDLLADNKIATDLLGEVCIEAPLTLK